MDPFSRIRPRLRGAVSGFVRSLRWGRMQPTWQALVLMNDDSIEPAYHARSSGLPYPAQPPTTREDLPLRPLPGAPAAWGLRAAGRLIDYLLFTLLFGWLASLLGTGTTTKGDFTGPTWPLLLFPIFFLIYETVAISLNGQTLGKWVVQVKVVRYRDGGVPELSDATVRAFVPGIFFLLSTIGVIAGASITGFLQYIPVLIYLSSIANILYRGPHDKAGGTIVLAAPRPKRERA